MSKALKQFLQMQGVLYNNLPPGFLDRFDSKIMQKIISDPVTAGREFARFLENGARTQLAANILRINRRSLLLPENVLGPEWGIASMDVRSEAMSSIDLSEVEFDICADEEGNPLTGEQGMDRMRAKGRILLDAGVWKALCDAPLAKFKGRWASDVRIYFDGTKFFRTGGKSGEYYTLYIDYYRGRNGTVNWDYTRTDQKRPAKWVSATLPDLE